MPRRPLPRVGAPRCSLQERWEGAGGGGGGGWQRSGRDLKRGVGRRKGRGLGEVQWAPREDAARLEREVSTVLSVREPWREVEVEPRRRGRPTRETRRTIARPARALPGEALGPPVPGSQRPG